jgi:ribosomal protein L11 methyltransferase
VLRIAIRVAARDTERALGILHGIQVSSALVQEPGDLGTADDPVPQGRVRIVVFAEHQADAHRIVRVLRARVRGPCRVTPFRNEDWPAKFRAHHRAVPVGRRLIVAPPWARLAQKPGRIALRIDPGLAFGTGSHASTYLCLRATLDLSRARSLGRVLDVGTGSGILAFAAARLGAHSVLGVDPDPEALAAARANARLNGIGRAVRLRLAGIAEVRGRYDLVLANLLRDLLVGEAPSLAARLAPGGRAVLSGLLDVQAADVRAAFEAQDLRLARHLSREGWSALVMERASVRGHGA